MSYMQEVISLTPEKYQGYGYWSVTDSIGINIITVN